MKKYIDFEVAREYLHKACASIGGNGGAMLKIKFDEEPTIELPIGIEWCRDCKHFAPLSTDKEDFCSKGERRTPTVDAKPVDKDKWIDVTVGDVKQCPNCKRFIKTSGQFDLAQCPNCGTEVKRGE